MYKRFLRELKNFRAGDTECHKNSRQGRRRFK